MQHDIVIKHSSIARFRIWAGRSLESLAWLLGFGLIASGISTAGVGALAGLFFRHDMLLGSTLLGGVLLTIAGCMVLLRRLEGVVRHLGRKGGDTDATA